MMAQNTRQKESDNKKRLKMKKVKVSKINGFIYELVDEKSNKYRLNIEFYDLPFKVKENDLIYFMDEKLLIKRDMYVFGDLNSIYGKKIANSNSLELIVIDHSNTKYYLKRLYG